MSKVKRPNPKTVYDVYEIAIRVLYRGNVEPGLWSLGQRFAGVVLGVTWSRGLDLSLLREFMELLDQVWRSDLLRCDEIERLEKAFSDLAKGTGEGAFMGVVEQLRKYRERSHGGRS